MVILAAIFVGYLAQPYSGVISAAILMVILAAILDHFGGSLVTALSSMKEQIAYCELASEILFTRKILHWFKICWSKATCIYAEVTDGSDWQPGAGGSEIHQALPDSLCKDTVALSRQTTLFWWLHQAILVTTRSILTSNWILCTHVISIKDQTLKALFRTSLNKTTCPRAQDLRSRQC